MAAIGQPVKKIVAHHTGRNVSKATEEEADNLSPDIHIVVGSDLPLSTSFRVLVFCVMFTYRFGTPARVRAI